MEGAAVRYDMHDVKVEVMDHHQSKPQTTPTHQQPAEREGGREGGIGMIKPLLRGSRFVLCGIPAGIALSIFCAGVALLFLPWHYCDVAYSLMRTRLLPRQLTLLLGMLTFVGALLWVPLVFAVSLLGSIFVLMGILSSPDAQVDTQLHLQKLLQQPSAALVASAAGELAGQRVDGHQPRGDNVVGEGEKQGGVPEVTEGEEEEMGLADRRGGRQILVAQASCSSVCRIERWILSLMVGAGSDFWMWNRHIFPESLMLFRRGTIGGQLDPLEEPERESLSQMTALKLSAVCVHSLGAAAMAALGVASICLLKALPALYVWCLLPFSDGTGSSGDMTASLYLFLLPLFLLYAMAGPFIIAAAALIIVPGTFFYGGAQAVLATARTGRFPSASHACARIVADFDLLTSDILGLRRPFFGCLETARTRPLSLPRLASRPLSARPRSAPSGQARLLLRRSAGSSQEGSSCWKDLVQATGVMSCAWDALLDRCYAMGCDLLRTGVYTREVFLSQEPFMHLGLPAASLVQCICDSISTQCPGLKLGNDFELSPQLWSPTLQLIDVLWEPLQQAKDEFARQNLTKKERTYLIEFTALCSSPLCGDAATEGAGDEMPLSAERVALLNRLASRVIGIAIKLTRLPQMRRRISQMIARILEEAPTDDGKRGIPYRSGAKRFTAATATSS
jgi:hypothetical protein